MALNLDVKSKIPQFGEVFITNDELNGSIESLQLFKGKLILGACGGYQKHFLIEQGKENDGIVSSLHAPQFDDYQYTYSDDGQSGKNLEDIFRVFENKGQIKYIACGKQHSVFLTDEGKLYSYGVGQYGSLGHGGIINVDIPQLIQKVDNRKFCQVACGEFHTLALTDDHDLYSWGRGFEGQLGLNQETSSVPLFVSFFYQFLTHNSKNIQKGKEKPQKSSVTYIACGAYHSLAITQVGSLYTWGEARLGQTGTGKHQQIEKLPTLVRVGEEQKTDEKSPRVKISPMELEDKEQQQIKWVSGGFAHSIAITQSGEMYSWGFNLKGQLGLGDRQSRYTPTRIRLDILGNELPRFTSVSCGYSSSFSIDESGGVWSWGGGNLGQQNDHIQDLPRQITENTENRVFTDVFASMNATTFFAKMRSLSVRPNYGPSCGGTIITIVGTGFADTTHQAIRFKYGHYVMETSLVLDPVTETFSCQTPKFEDVSEEVIKWPLLCDLEVTLDGKIYEKCENQFLIYSSKITVTSITPKYASVTGATQLTLSISFDELTASYLKHLTVGFQPQSQKEEQKQGDTGTGLNLDELGLQKANSGTSIGHAHSGKHINPLDISTSDPELEQENWVCVEAKYEKGKITCQAPVLETFQSDSLQFNVDVCINGQQFTGQPNSFRFYDVQITEFEPKIVTHNGGAQVKICGNGFFDTLTQQLLVESALGDRIIDLIWDKKDRSFTFFSPPISWLLGGLEPNPELIEQVEKNDIKVKLSLNGIEWINVGKIYFIDPVVHQIALGPVIDPKEPQEERKKKFLTPNVKDVDPLASITNPAELEKKKVELAKIQENETIELTTLFQKAGSYLYIIGDKFLEGTEPLVRFIFNSQAKVIKGVYKNEKKIAIIVPELDFNIPPGIHDIGIEVSFNEQEFTQNGKTFRYLAFDQNMPADQRVKWEDEQLKALKKPPGKK